MLNKQTKYRRGVNLGGWLSQCNYTKERYDTFIVESDFETIKSWGLDFVRVPVDYQLVEDNEGNYIEENFSYIQKAIDWSKKNGLHMILDLHKTAGFFFHEEAHESGFFDDTEEGEMYRERFYKRWEEFAKRYGKYDDMLSFELLNEVTDQAYMPMWSSIILKCVKRIRAIAPDIDIVIGGYWNNAVEAVKDLPKVEDAHITYSFHCYEPLAFTHQGAAWIPDNMINHSARPSLEEMNYKTEDVIEFFKEAVDAANERGVALFCGEYGTIDKVTPEDTVGWFKVMNEAFEYYGISRSAWSYKQMDFGLTDARLNGVRSTLLNYL